MRNTPPTENDLEPGRLIAVVPKRHFPELLVPGKLLDASESGILIQRAYGTHRVTAYGSEAFYRWSDIDGVHVTTREASHRFFAPVKNETAGTNAGRS